MAHWSIDNKWQGRWKPLKRAVPYARLNWASTWIKWMGILERKHHRYVLESYYYCTFIHETVKCFEIRSWHVGLRERVDHRQRHWDSFGRNLLVKRSGKIGNKYEGVHRLIVIGSWGDTNENITDESINHLSKCLSKLGNLSEVKLIL